MNLNDSELNRIRWQCRRGMLELDLLLFDFLNTRYPNLDPAARGDFSRLLEQPDQTLQRWLLGDGSDVIADLRRIVGIIRLQGVERP